MKITDKRVKAELKRINSSELNYDLSIIEDGDDDIQNLSEWEIFLKELQYVTECFEEEGHTLCEDLTQAKELLRETKNGKIIRMSLVTFEPVYGYAPHNIESARKTVNEYNRLKLAVKRLLK